LQNFQAELAIIGKARNDIKAYQAEIKKIKNQQMVIAVIVIIVGLITTVLLCSVAFGMISSLT
jgi:hypothetical protein